MNQQQNFTTLLIPGTNGSQPQMIKVVGSTKIPMQLATSTGSSLPTIKRVFKTSEQGSFIQDGKLHGRPFITIPAKPTISVPGIRGPLVVPMNNVQLKQQTTSADRDINTNGNGPVTIPSSIVICNQDGVATSTIPSLSLPIQVSKQPIAGKMAGTPILQTVVKQITVPKPQNFPLLTMSNEQTDEIEKNDSKIQYLRPISDNVLTTSSICGSPPKTLMNTSILDHSGLRKRHDFEFDYSIENKRRKSEKGGKGLRHFSMKVCEKVKAKGTTSYNEVADELVHEFTESTRPNPLTDTASYDQKNIRRRVYDALNVLMAMNIISKEKKEIKWLGLPTNSAQECSKLEQDKKKVLQRIKLKTQQLQDLILQQIAFKNLVERNRKRELEIGEPQWTAALQLPFIIVNTDQDTTIDCSISNAKEEYLFNFDNTFEIHDDIEVLKRMGMSLGLEKGICTPENLILAKKIIPKALEDYVVELAKSSPDDEATKNKSLSSCLELVNENSSDLTVSIKEERILQMPLSRHSSFSSLSHERRNGSRSPSSFGDFDDSDMEL